MRIPVIALWLGLVSFALASTLSAQAGKSEDKAAAEAQRLDQLLRELAKTTPAAWQARLRALEAEAKGFEAQAGSLRKRSEVATRKAAATRDTMKRMRQVMALIQSGTPPAAKGKNPATMKPKAQMKPKAGKKPKPAPGKKVTSAAAAKPGATGKATAPAVAEPKGGFVTYDDHVQEIFMTHCSACHDSNEKESGLDLTSFAAARAGGSSGTTIVPGDIDQSRLYQLVAHLQKPTMPPDEGPIEKKSIDLIRRWIEQGAPENKAGARSRAAKRRARAPAAAVAKPKFDQPAPMPASWPVVALAPTVRAVGTKTLAASPRSPLLAIPGQNQVLVLRSDSREPVGILPFEHGDVEVLAFSPDGSRLLAAGGTPGKRGRAVLYDVASGKPVGTYGKEFDTVLAAAVHPRLTLVALGGSSRRVRVFDVATGALRFELDQHDEWILGLNFSDDGRFLASVDRGGVVVLTEATTGRNVEVIRRHKGPVHAVRFAPDSRSYATVGADRTLRLFAVKGARQITQRNTGARPLAVAFSPDGKFLAAGTDDGRTRIFRGNGAPLFTLPATQDWVYSVAFDQTSKTVFAGDFRGRTTVFDLATRKATDTLSPTTSAADPVRNL